MNRRLVEIAAVFLTAIAKWVMVDWLELRPYFIVSAISFWTIFIISNAKKQGRPWASLGLGKEGLRSTTWVCLSVGIPFAIAFGIYGAINETELWQPSLIPVLLLYPIWGLLQQLITMNFVARNLSDLNVRNSQSILITGFAFALVHLPDLPLALATLALGLFYGGLFLKYRNIWPLGILHGWLGALFYYWVLGRDPWAEILLALG